MIAKFKKNRKLKKTGSKKDMIFSISIVVLFIGLVVFLIFTNLKINKKRARLISRIETLKGEIQILEEKNKQLKENFSQAGTKEHLEKVAREQFGLKDTGEEVVVITKEEEEERAGEEKEEKNFWNPKYWWEWLRGK